jgi:hypothetical protein
MPSQIRRKAPVPTFRIALEHEPGDRVALFPVHALDLERVHAHRVRREGHLALWSAFALVIASKFLASALMR